MVSGLFGKQRLSRLAAAALLTVSTLVWLWCLWQEGPWSFPTAKLDPAPFFLPMSIFRWTVGCIQRWIACTDWDISIPHFLAFVRGPGEVSSE